MKQEELERAIGQLTHLCKSAKVPLLITKEGCSFLDGNIDGSHQIAARLLEGEAKRVNAEQRRCHVELLKRSEHLVGFGGDDLTKAIRASEAVLQKTTEQ